MLAILRNALLLSAYVCVACLDLQRSNGLVDLYVLCRLVWCRHLSTLSMLLHRRPARSMWWHLALSLGLLLLVQSNVLVVQLAAWPIAMQRKQSNFTKFLKCVVTVSQYMPLTKVKNKIVSNNHDILFRKCQCGQQSTFPVMCAPCFVTYHTCHVLQQER